MQIARQVYGIVTAENGLCFTKDGQTVVWMCGCWMDVGDGNDGMDVWCGMSSDT